MSTPYVDPGWRRAVTPWLLLGFVFGLPLIGRRVIARLLDRPGDGLVALRQVFLNFVVAVVLVGVVATVLAPSQEATSTSAQLAAAALVVLGIASLAACEWFGRLPLDCSEEATLAAGYRARFLIRVAFAECIALLGFVATLVVARPWLYWLAAAFTFAGFWRLAPSARNLAADQARLARLGCRLSLASAVAVGSRSH